MIFSSKAPDNLDDLEWGPLLTKTIIDTIQEPLIILDESLIVIAASKSFYKKFGLDIESVQDRMFYDLGESGAWDIPELRKLLEEVIPQQKVVEGYEISHNFKKLGFRIMILNAREIRYQNGKRKMLVSIFDVTEQRNLEHQNENLARQKDILLQEMRHRIANSLQIIASILLLKAASVTSEETKTQLEDVHDRIMSIATVQGHLDPAGLAGDVDVASYLSALCQSLTKSMIGDRRPLVVKVNAGEGKVTTDEAIGLGLITTELILNAIKHAFAYEEEGIITVTYKATDTGWKLTVMDNGQGMSMSKNDQDDRKGLGTGIIDSLTKQLDAIVKTESTSEGTTISIVHEK